MSKASLIGIIASLTLIVIGHGLFYLYFQTHYPLSTGKLAWWLNFLTRLGFMQFIYVLPCIILLMKRRDSVVLKWVLGVSGATLLIAIGANVAKTFVMAAAAHA